MPAETSCPADLAANLASVRRRILTACDRAGRDPGSVTLVAVTKSVGVEAALELARLGVEDFGENRPDELSRKRSAFEAVGVRVRWHMIGHLQTNKLLRALPRIDVLHSLDRTSLAQALTAELSRSAGPRLPVLVQVNVSGEASKGGFGEIGLWDALAAVRAVGRLSIRGLMTMAPAAADPESSRPVFRRLRELRDEAHARGYLGGLDLSMGMSLDFEIAVEEGATLLRVGSTLFSS